MSKIKRIDNQDVIEFEEIDAVEKLNLPVVSSLPSVGVSSVGDIVYYNGLMYYYNGSSWVTMANSQPVSGNLWAIGGNTASADSIVGTLNNYDVIGQRAGQDFYRLESGGMAIYKDLYSWANVTVGSNLNLNLGTNGYLKINNRNVTSSSVVLTSEISADSNLTINSPHHFRSNSTPSNQHDLVNLEYVSALSSVYSTISNYSGLTTIYGGLTQLNNLSGNTVFKNLNTGALNIGSSDNSLTLTGGNIPRFLIENTTGNIAIGSNNTPGIRCQFQNMDNSSGTRKVGISESSGSNGNQMFLWSTGGSYIDSFNSPNNTVSSLILNSSGGNVGIGKIPNASYKLDVNGTINVEQGLLRLNRLTVTEGSELHMYMADGTNLYSLQVEGATTNAQDLRIYRNNDLFATMNNSGNFGIGKIPNASYKLDVNGIAGVGSRLLGTPDGANIFWIGLQGSAGDGDRVALGIGGNSSASGTVTSLLLNTNSATRLIIDNNGFINFGNGSNSYRYQFTTLNGTGSNIFSLSETSGSGSNHVWFHVNSTGGHLNGYNNVLGSHNDFNIFSGGNGTQKLNVNGNLQLKTTDNNTLLNMRPTSGTTNGGTSAYCGVHIVPSTNTNDRYTGLTFGGADGTSIFTGSQAGLLCRTNNTQGSKLYLCTTNNYSSGINKYPIQCAHDGKVMINGSSTSTPAYTLDVSGDINASGDIKKNGVNILTYYAYGRIDWNAGTSTLSLDTAYKNANISSVTKVSDGHYRINLSGTAPSSGSYYIGHATTYNKLNFITLTYDTSGHLFNVYIYDGTAYVNGSLFFSCI